MVLDGLQQTIFEELHGVRCINEYFDGYLIRFADDILVTASSEERGHRIIRIIENFLQKRGMRLSLEKTSIINTHQGFDFLSRHYEMDGKAVVSYPSDLAVKKMEYSLHELIPSFRGSQKSLIDKINKKLYGWASYHKVSDARKAFRLIDVVVKALLLQLCKSLHPAWKLSKIINQYFFQDHRGKYVYALKNKKDVRVIQLSDVALIEHIPRKYVNPYLPPTSSDKIDENSDDKKYEEWREIQHVVGKYKSIWNRQSGRCFYCCEEILADQEKSLVKIQKKEGRRTKYLAYVHAKCQQHQVEFIETEDFCETYEDIVSIIKKLSKNPSKQEVRNKGQRQFSALFEYFRDQEKPHISMTFKDISNIIGRPLCKTASKEKRYWFRKNPGSIAKLGL